LKRRELKSPVIGKKVSNGARRQKGCSLALQSKGRSYEDREQRKGVIGLSGLWARKSWLGTWENWVGRERNKLHRGQGGGTGRDQQPN